MLVAFLEEHMNTGLRAYGATVDSPMFFDLENYGCWCQGDILTQGHGTFQDDFDKICYNKYRGLECIYMDSVDQGDPCDVETVTYGFETTIIYDDGTPVSLVFSCQDENAAEFCSRNKCLIELRAMLDYQTLAENHFFPDVDTFGHIGFFEGRGTFDPSKLNCELGGPGVLKTDKECCGDYPFRNYFFHDIMNTKDCCEYEVASLQQTWNDTTLLVGQAFDTAVDVCCETGVFTVGTC